MIDLTYLKDYKKYNELIHDVDINFPKYKTALFNYYKDNNEEFIFNKFPFCDDIILIIYLNEYNYPRDIVIKSLDYLLNKLTNNMYKILVLNFLLGFGIINQEELDKRKSIHKIKKDIKSFFILNMQLNH